MVQLQVEAEKLQLSCNVLPTGLAPEGIKLSNIWIQLAQETKGLIAQDYLQGKVDEDGLLQLEVHRLGINELGRYILIVKYSYESPERSTEGRTKYECILPAFEVVREERRQRLGSSELVAQGSSIQPIGLPTSPGTSEDTASLTPEQLKTLIDLQQEEIEALKKENEKLKEQANDTADGLWRFAVDLTREPAKDGQPLLTESSLVRFGINRD